MSIDCFKTIFGSWNFHAYVLSMNLPDALVSASASLFSTVWDVLVVLNEISV